MVVVFEFLGTEPIENVITCMHYKVDKVVYFGYHEVIQSLKNSTDKFLKKYCGVTSTVYHAMPKDDLQMILKSMRKEIEYELGQKNRIYFDITGGESLILVAFGMLSAEYKTPMHHFDVRKDKLIKLNDAEAEAICKNVPERKIDFTLDSYIELRGGVINYNLQKEMKDGLNKHAEDVEKLWEVAKKHQNYWNPLSNALRAAFIPDDDLSVKVSVNEVLNILSNAKSKLARGTKLEEILKALAEKGLLKSFVCERGRYQFQFKNQFVKECLWDGGSVLELHIYQCEKVNADDCRIGVHIDWDGKITYPEGTDVLNEIDVLTLKGNIPTFISCKSGKMDGNKALPALYELETVARRFGGKYAKKVLAVTSSIGEAYLARAEEMGIEIQCEK